MSLDKTFSSKPKQIAQAALQALSKVYGNLEKVKIIVISDMQLALNIAENFQKSRLGNCRILEESLEKLSKTTESDQNKSTNFLEQIKNFDMVMIGYKSQMKLIDRELVKKVLNARKKKPIFFIDCGIPGNICVDIGNLSNCYLFDLNDLEQLYTSWIQNNDVSQEGYEDLYDLDFRVVLDAFFLKFKFNLEQKMIFEKKIKALLRSDKNGIKVIIQNFLKNI